MNKLLMKTIIILMVIFSSCKKEPVLTEYDILMEFFNSTGGPNWTHKTGWGDKATLNTIGAWYGVAVYSKTVTELNLYGNNLTGTIPASFGQLKDVTYLNSSLKTLVKHSPIMLL